MKKVFICIGVAGVGKSTYINKNKTDRSIVLSSDEIRKEIFGTLNCQTSESHQKVFNLMRKRLELALLDSSIEEIFYDATNLNRKRRIALYNDIKRINEEANVVALTFIKPLKEIIEQDSKRTGFAKVGEEVIIRQYKSFQVPRLGVDCDEIKNANQLNSKAFLDEYKKDTPHNSSYHKESVKEHIEMCIENAKKTGDSKLVEIAKYHDLGKFICKEFINEERTIARFRGHENVSSMYYLGLMNDNITNEKLMILEAIYQHMVAHNGISEKLINRNKLTEEDLELIYNYQKIDSVSKAV